MFRAVSQYTAIRSISYTIPQCKVYDFTGDQIWWSIRKPGLDTSKQAGGRRTILIPREDFWEGTVYGHGGEAKLFQGLKNDQGAFENAEGTVEKPADRQYALIPEGQISDREDSHDEIATKMDSFKSFAREYWLNRLNRGYSGSVVSGMYIPTMSPVEAQRLFGRTFDDFRCVILEMGRVGSMAPKIGRIYKARVTVAVGNGKGVFGVATAMDDLATEAIVIARQQAFRNLQDLISIEFQSIDLHEGRTIAGPVYHNYYMTWMNLRPQPKGFGIRAHRLLKRIVDVAGIKDIHITLRGARPSSQMSAINCLLRALQEIENPNERANRTGYHVVRIDPQKGDKPTVVAKPNEDRLNVFAKTKNYPITKKYMNQKLHVDFFNYSYSGFHRADYKGRRFHNLIRFGRTGSHMTGHMEYSQMPRAFRELKNARIPENFIGESTFENGVKEYDFETLNDIEIGSCEDVKYEKFVKNSLVDPKGFRALENSRYANSQPV